MKYLTFTEKVNATYPVCILVTEIKKDEIKKAYLDPHGLLPEHVIVISLEKNKTGKTPIKVMREYIEQELKPILDGYSVRHVLVADSDYYKAFQKGTVKPERMLGYIGVTEYGSWNVSYIPTYRTMFYDPETTRDRIKIAMDSLKAWESGTYVAPGNGILKFKAYARTTDEVQEWLDKLLEMDRDLTCDTENYSLKHYDAGLGTIAFAWNKHEGVCLAIDKLDDPEHSRICRELLREFFIKFKRKMIYHNIAYDVYVLIYVLFMKDILDNDGLLTGLSILLRNWDDTKLISYLATNSCAGNHLSLKDQAQEFAGNYAVDDIKDIRLIPLPQLMEYNLVDAVSTWYVYEKHWQTIIDDNQHDIYLNIFKRAIIDIIQMQLTGMPVNMERVLEVEQLLLDDEKIALNRLKNNRIVHAYQGIVKQAYIDKRNAKLKTKIVTMNDDEVKLVSFNPGSDPQVQKLLFEILELPVLYRTDSKAPSTDGDTLKALKHHTKDPEIIDLLEALLDLNTVTTITTNFIPALKTAQLGKDGWHYLFGNFNLGGTVSGRLSSSKPNLQNIPAHDKHEKTYGKWIKSCFEAPPGWLFCGIDFSSLEDRISGLTTKDPNKLKVYTEGWDGHAMRAVVYFADKMPDIDPTNKEQVNSIAQKGHKYAVWRQDSKPPTFALTYQGTYITLMVNCGFSEELAKRVEAAYHELYVVSDKWVEDKLEQASKDGYVTVAFGLRVRTPLLAQVVRGNSKTPYAASAEGRTAGNALGQSWCLLNSRAGSDFMGGVRTSEFKHDIRPCAQIHDAQYYMIRDNLNALSYANIHLVKACEWNDHPDIYHPEVGLGGEFSIFYPNWSKEAVIPNGATGDEIKAAFKKHLDKLAA
jgi:DNA polymerase-1